MLEPLRQFICDGCGQIIQRVDEGWVEWLNDDDHHNHGFRIVHHASVRPLDRRCYAYDDHPNRADLHLRCFTGNVGMVRALSLLHPGALHCSDPNRSGILNANEYGIFLRRLFFPYYEDARRYFDEAENDGFIGDANEVLVYTEGFLRELIERYE